MRRKNKPIYVFSNFTLVEGHSLGKDNALGFDKFFILQVDRPQIKQNTYYISVKSNLPNIWVLVHVYSN